MRRLNRMFGAISATNEAILRAKTAQELYQLVCDAAVHGGKSLAAVVLLAEPDSIWLKPVAGTGDIVELITKTRFSIDPDNIYGNGVCGNAFRTQKPCVNPDILNSVQGTAVAAGRTRDRRRGLRRASARQGRQEHRRVDVLRQQILGRG